MATTVCPPPSHAPPGLVTMLRPAVVPVVDAAPTGLTYTPASLHSPVPWQHFGSLSLFFGFLLT